MIYIYVYKQGEQRYGTFTLWTNLRLFLSLPVHIARWAHMHRLVINQIVNICHIPQHRSELMCVCD